MKLGISQKQLTYNEKKAGDLECGWALKREMEKEHTDDFPVPWGPAIFPTIKFMRFLVSL